MIRSYDENEEYLCYGCGELDRFDQSGTCCSCQNCLCKECVPWVCELCKVRKEEFGEDEDHDGWGYNICLDCVVHDGCEDCKDLIMCSRCHKNHSDTCTSKTRGKRNFEKARDDVASLECKIYTVESLLKSQQAELEELKKNLVDAKNRLSVAEKDWKKEPKQEAQKENWALPVPTQQHIEREQKLDGSYTSSELKLDRSYTSPESSDKKQLKKTTEKLEFPPGPLGLSVIRSRSTGYIIVDEVRYNCALREHIKEGDTIEAIGTWSTYNKSTKQFLAEVQRTSQSKRVVTISRIIKPPPPEKPMPWNESILTWYNFYVKWDYMVESIRDQWAILGFTKNIWESKSRTTEILQRQWCNLTPEQQAAAMKLGYRPKANEASPALPQSKKTTRHPQAPEDKDVAPVSPEALPTPDVNQESKGTCLSSKQPNIKSTSAINGGESSQVTYGQQLLSKRKDQTVLRSFFRSKKLKPSVSTGVE